MCITGVCVSGCIVLSVSHARWYSVVVVYMYLSRHVYTTCVMCALMVYSCTLPVGHLCHYHR